MGKIETFARGMPAQSPLEHRSALKRRDITDLQPVSSVERRNAHPAKLSRVATGLLDRVARRSIVLGAFVLIAVFALVFCSYSDFDESAVEPAPGQVVPREAQSAEERPSTTFLDDVVKTTTVLPIQAKSPPVGELDESLRVGFDSAPLTGPAAPAEPAPVLSVFAPAASVSEEPPQAQSVQPLPVKASQAHVKAASKPPVVSGLRKVFYDKPLLHNGRWVLWHGAGHDN
jgi:hypothetical protein